ncbi:hypothetical protein GCM10023160_27190 [Brachybacterium paraconglomeratum]
MQEDDSALTEFDDVQIEPLKVTEDPVSELQGVSESQGLEAEKFAIEFLSRVIRLRGVRIDREHFLRSELHRRGISNESIDAAVAENPAASGIGIEMLDRIAAEVVEFETRKSTAMSFAAGIPGGFAMIGTIPGDITQFYVHAFRIMQKVAYVYGWREFLSDTDHVDDETLGKLTAFLGVMMGVGGASATVTNFAANIARPAIQRQIAGVALTKTAWYTPMKQVLRVVGVKLTKDSFAKAVSKAVPVAGGVISGSLTYATLRVQSARLIKHLRQLPPPNVDAEAYLARLFVIDEAEAERVESSLRGRGLGAVRETSSKAKGVAGSVKGRVGSLLSRRQAAEDPEADGEA